LITALKSKREEDIFIREGAAIAIGRLTPHAGPAVPALADALDDLWGPVRLKAVSVLGDIGPDAKPAVPALIKAFKHWDLFVLVRSFDAIAKIGPEAKLAIPHLIMIIIDDYEFAVLAANALECLGPQAKSIFDVSLLSDRAIAHKSGAKPAVAPISLFPAMDLRLSPPAPIPDLLANLKMKDEEKQITAAADLAWYGPKAKEALPALVSHFKKDDNPKVRAAVAGVIGRMEKEAKDCVPMLLAALKEKDRTVSGACAEALCGLGDVAIPEVLEVAFTEKDLELRRAAALILKDTRYKAVPFLVQALKKPERNARAGAVVALGRIGTTAKDAMPALLEAAESPDDVVRQLVVLVLPQIDPKDKKTADALVNALKDKDALVRLHAAFSLGKIGPDATIPGPTA
jgi:HEAT repeat protein